MNMEKRLYLIDGHALVFKMYYALSSHPMINSKGVDTSILYGFTKYVLELIEKEQPSHLGVAFDPPGGTFRHDVYPEYKGTRAATPQAIIDALEPLCGICKALGIPVLMIPDYEADDVIGSMSKKAESEGFKVCMVTPDKDYGQLVTDNVVQLKPGKAGSDSEVFDKARVCEKYGVDSPEKVIDYLTICGDSSDNVPGVKGVGEVGARKLLSEYGSVDGIYSRLDKLKPKQRELFEAARDHIDMSRFLVTIKTDLDLSDFPIEAMALTGKYGTEAFRLFDEYEFKSLKRYLGEAPADYQVEQQDFVFDRTSPAELCSYARENGLCSIARSNDKYFLASKNGKGIVTASGQAGEFASVLSDKSIAKTGYALKEIWKKLNTEGFAMEGRLLDIELMDYIINPEKSHQADVLSMTVLGISLEDKKEEGEPSLFDSPAESEDKSREVAVYLALGEKVNGMVKEKSLDNLYDRMEEPLIRVLARMETEGVKVDMAQLRRYADSLSAELSAIQDKIRKEADEPQLNILSPKQIGVLLFEKLKLDPKIKAKNGVRYEYPTDEDTLVKLLDKNEVVGDILEYRAVRKLLNTYIEPFQGFVSPVTGKIHTTFNQALTATGRLSSVKPNLQNIPVRSERGKEIRRAFVPSRPDGVIISADYSQIELRIMAHLSCDSNLVEAFRANEDIHAMTASKIFGVALEKVTPEQRRIAKTANFGIIYGISAFGLSQRLRISRNDAKNIIDDYFKHFPSISYYIEDTLAAARENGYVETVFGRRRYLPDINSRNATVRSLAERNAINAPIQGTAADIIKMAMINVDRRMAEAGLKSRMVLQIHDELLFDAVQDEAGLLKQIVVGEMENVVKLTVPLTVECNEGKNWLEAH